jgi:hypothetical protein
MRLFVSLVPDAGSTATVTLVTDQVELHRAYSLLVVPPGAVLSTLSHQSAHPQAQIEARLLAAPVMTRQVTAPTTGRGHQPALYAHGLVTFYNQAPTPQAIPAGMLLGGVDGVSVVTDQAVSVPAARLPAQGQVSVQVSVSCMAETHNAKEMQSQINALNEQEATARLGSTYALQGQIAESVQAVTAVDDRQGVVRLQIQTASVWAYQLSASQIHALIASVAGDPIQKSRALLLHGRGIHQVSITSTDWWDGTSHQSLPTDPSRIKLLVISWEGV